MIRSAPPPLHLLGTFPVSGLSLPMVATRICAGFPSPADDFMDDELDLQQLLAPNRPATFMWRVQGTSMIEAGIHDGDVVVVDRSVTPADGHVVVACIDGTVSLKLFRRGQLVFANRAMPVFLVDDAAEVEIWGVVTWTLHKPRG